MTLTDAEVIDPTENPAQANAMVAQILSQANGTSEPLPTIDLPADDIVALPGGLVREEFGRPDVLVAREAQVRELTGEDEETIAKARRGGDITRFTNALLQCGTVKIGDEKPTTEILNELLIGDRDALILGIRRATYGDDIVIPEFQCPGCTEKFELTLTVDEIKIRALEDPLTETKFTVPLRRGGEVRVRFPRGDDMAAAVDSKITTEAERNTVLLTRCVQTLTDAEGNAYVVAGNPAMVKGLGLADRHRILKEIKDRQPGPQYDDVKFTHSCGREVEVYLGLVDLFRDL